MAKKSSKENEICPTCFNSRRVTIYENAGFAYKGKPYKIKCQHADKYCGIMKKKRISHEAIINLPLLQWMDKKLTERFITKKGVTNRDEITHIKFTIWDFLTEFKEKTSKKK